MRKMPKIKIEKTMVNTCCICDLNKRLDQEADIAFERAKASYPEADLYSTWQSEVTDNHTVPGFKITYIRPATEKEVRNYWNINNGMYEASATHICTQCYDKITQCFTRLGDAEEIAFATKESWKDAPGYTAKEFVKPEESEEK